MNTCRDPLWAEKNCFVDHYIYLSKTSKLKVGITKYTQIPYRWIAQGAVQALPFIKVKSRYQAGLVECIMKNYISDKTNRKKMLFSEIDNSKILDKRHILLKKLLNKINFMNKELNSNIEILKPIKPFLISYPVKKNPKEIKSVNFGYNNKKYEDILVGIKGQYLIFNKGVINMSKILGYKFVIQIS